MKKFIAIILILFTLSMTGCSEATDLLIPGPVTLNIAAVSSLNNALTELQPIFESQYSDIKLNISYGSSDELASEIIQGSNTDFFIASSQKSMNELADQNLIDPETRENFISNSLMLIVPLTSGVTSVDSIDTVSINSLIIGDPDMVPVGHYAIEALTNMGIYEQVENKLIYAKSVKELLEAVETRQAEGGIVFLSDALNDIRVRVVGELPAGTYSAVNYPMAEIAGTNHTEQVSELEQFLLSETAQDIMYKYGFSAAVNQ